MKVLYVNITREYGSTGKIIKCLENYLKNKGDNVRFCFNSGKILNKIEDNKVSSRVMIKIDYLLGYLIGIPYGVSFISTLRVIKVIKKEKPNIVHLHSLNGHYINIYLLIWYLKKNKINTIITNHSEYLYTGNCTHSFDCNQWEKGCIKCNYYRQYRLSMIFDTTKFTYKLMKKVFNGFNNCIVVSVSPWVYKRSLKSNIMNGVSQVVVINGIDELIFKLRGNEHLRKKHNLFEKKVMLFSSAYFSDQDDDIKGGKFIIKIASLAKKFDIKIIVVAFSINVTQDYDNIICVGSVKDDEEMAEYYSLADVVLLPSRKETFSMVVAEALMCGTPVSGFNSGGPETITIPEYSRFCKYGDYELLFKNALELMNKKFDKKEISLKAKAKYSSKIMCEQYYQLYTELIKNNN